MMMIDYWRGWSSNWASSMSTEEERRERAVHRARHRHRSLRLSGIGRTTVDVVVEEDEEVQKGDCVHQQQ